MSSAVSFDLPWPPTASSPNGSQGNWRGKASAGRDYKADCWAACKAARIGRMDADAVEVTLIFCPPANRAFDLDNMLARFKRGGDAVAEAIGVDDSRWQSITLERGPKVKGGCVAVGIVPATWRPIGAVAARIAAHINPEAAE